MSSSAGNEVIILRYTDALQKLLGSKTKPEPWLHCGICQGVYAIWVWDTRKVIETGSSRDAWSFNVTKFVRANDNHEPLDGKTGFERMRTDMQYWPCIAIANQHHVHFPSLDEANDQITKWSWKGHTFNGNNAMFPEYAKRIATWYNKDRKKNFNSLVTKILIAMMTDAGSYTAHGVSGQSFNDILFDIDNAATNLARTILKARQ